MFSTEPELAIQRRNLSELLTALRAMGVSRVEVTYAGARGRCTSCEVMASPPNVLPGLRHRLVEQFRLAADAGQPSPAPLSDTVSLRDALTHFTLHWASLQHGHWQRGDGGCGVMRIDVSMGQLTLDHDAIVIENLHARLSE